MASNPGKKPASSESMRDEPQDPILASIRTIEAIRDFAADINPLRPDGNNFHEWINEIEKTLSDLIDREQYLQGPPPDPINKAEDKIARNLIYWTISRELRSCINPASSAREAYHALKTQFLRNNRTAHMAAFVDLFNFQMQVSEPQHITILYDRMYKGMHELVSSGFVINEDTLLGALFQIAVGRGNSQLYTATSKLLDAKVSSNHLVTSHEVCAAARRQLESWRTTITVFDEGQHPSDVADPQVHADEDSHPVSLADLRANSSANNPEQVTPATNPTDPSQPRNTTGSPAVPQQPESPGGTDSSNTDAHPAIPSQLSKTSSSQDSNPSAVPLQVNQPINLPPHASSSQPVPTGQSKKSTDKSSVEGAQALSSGSSKTILGSSETGTTTGFTNPGIFGFAKLPSSGNPLHTSNHPKMSSTTSQSRSMFGSPLPGITLALGSGFDPPKLAETSSSSTFKPTSFLFGGSTTSRPSSTSVYPQSASSAKNSK